MLLSTAAGGGVLQQQVGASHQPFLMDLSIGAAQERTTPRTPRTLDTTAELRPSAGSNTMRPLMLAQGPGGALLTSSQLQQLGATAGTSLTAANAAVLTPSQLSSMQLGGLSSLGLRGRAGSLQTLLLQQQPGGMSHLSSSLLPLHGDLQLGQEQEMLKMHVNMACSQRAVEQLETRLVQERQSRNNDRMALNVMLQDMNTQLRTEVLRRQITEQQLAMERKLRNDLLAEIHAAGQVHEQLLQSEKIKAILQQLNFGEASLNAAACTPVPVLDMAQAVQGTAAMGIKTPRTDSNGSTPAPGGSEGRAGTQDNDEGRQGSSRRKQGKSRSRRLGSPRTAALRNASQEDLSTGGRRKRGSDKSASTTQGAAADAEQAPKAVPVDMGDRWAALCATVDQETQQMQHKEEQVGGLPLLAMSLPVEEAGPDSCTNSSAKGAHRMEEAGDAGGDNAMAKKRRLVTPSGVIVHLGD